MPAASPSGRRLGGAVLAYLVIVTLLITWAPFDFATRPQHGLTSLWTWSDLLLNVLMFMPLGFLWQGARRATVADLPSVSESVIGVVPALLAGALLSGIIETGQLFLAGRYTSLLDVLSNAVGAMLGAWVLQRTRSRLEVTSGTVRALALDLPLSGVIVLLLPLLWTWALGDDGGARTPLLWMAACTGGVLIGSVHGSYLSMSSPARDASIAATAWLLVGAMPTVLRSPSEDVLLHTLGAALLAALIGGWRSDRAARKRRADGAQRVEYRALRLAMPPFTVYVTLCALWPLTTIDGRWRAA
jgi:glycopeptide antibiotics resistance protein